MTKLIGTTIDTGHASRTAVYMYNSYNRPAYDFLCDFPVLQQLWLLIATQKNQAYS